MGWEPIKITYTSNYFQDFYELAVELIRRGHAYVNHQTADEIKECREKKMNSPWRDRPIAESLKFFNDMKSGLIEEGKAEDQLTVTKPVASELPVQLMNHIDDQVIMEPCSDKQDGPKKSYASIVKVLTDKKESVHLSIWFMK